MPARKENDYNLLKLKLVQLFKLKSENDIPLEINDLINRIYEDSNKYGLIWEDKKTRENFVEKLSMGYIPYIKEEVNKKIQSNLNSAGNLIIEGDNYHTLKVLQATHKEKVDIIYIDPPYNTGKGDFKYNDKISSKEDTYFHSYWLAFMDKRLRLAKNLMHKNSVIFLSIDENEFAQLKLLCDEIFQNNFLGSFIWLSGSGGANDKINNLSVSNEYILAYSKSKNFKFKLKEKDKSKFIKTIPYQNKAFSGRDNYRAGEEFQLTNINKQKDYLVDIKLLNGTFIKNYPSAFPQTTINEMQENGMIVSKNGIVFYKKSYLFDEKNGINQSNILENLGTTKAGNQILKNMGIELKKMYPKPVELIKYLISMCEIPNNAIILDFFAGTGTTGQAVLELNKENHNNYKFILATNNENEICSNILLNRIKNNILGYEYNSKNKKIIVEALGGAVSYYKVDFYSTGKQYKNETELLNETKLQEVYVNFIDGLIVIKEDIQDYHTFELQDGYIIVKNNTKQVIIIKHQIFNALTILSKIKSKLCKKLETNLYYFFPDFEGSTEDADSNKKFEEIIKNSIKTDEIHSIPKEYIRKMIGGDFQI